MYSIFRFSLTDLYRYISFLVIFDPSVGAERGVSLLVPLVLALQVTRSMLAPLFLCGAKLHWGVGSSAPGR